ncbi:MAG: DUF5822 domain-containing protein [Natronomonas sp.]
MPTPVESTNPEGIDYGWVMQVTFVLSILVGAPVVVVLSIPFDLPSWSQRVNFTIRVGAIVWFAIGLSVFLYARRKAST